MHDKQLSQKMFLKEEKPKREIFENEDYESTIMTSQSMSYRVYLPRVEAALLLPSSLYSCMNLNQGACFQGSEDQRKIVFNFFALI